MTDKRFPQSAEPPPLDMTLDGQFREPRAIPVAARIGGIAVLVAVVAGLGALALRALWFALALVPIALGAGLVAWAALRFQRWRSPPRRFGP
jgi:hypothetical protein